MQLAQRPAGVVSDGNSYKESENPLDKPLMAS